MKYRRLPFFVYGIVPAAMRRRSLRSEKDRNSFVWLKLKISSFPGEMGATSSLISEMSFLRLRRVRMISFSSTGVMMFVY